MSMTAHYKHISPWLLALFEKQPALVEPFVVALPESFDPIHPETIEAMGNVRGMPDHMKKQMQELMYEEAEIEEDMREEIKSMSPENALKILDEAKTRGFTLYKEYA